MKFGVTTFVTDEGIGATDLGRALEERAFESLFLAEHSHIPVKHETPGVADLPRWYYRTLDPFVVLTAVAVVTERIRLGTGVALVIQRDPIHTAKQVASLDHVSGGRVIFGVGPGWVREEMRNHGTDPRTRTALMRERVLAMKELWTSEEAEFHGERVSFDPVYLWPKPVQKPHPPILVGGEGPTVLDRVFEYGDGWLPRAKAGLDVLAEKITEMRRLAVERGREPVPVTIFGAGVDRAEVDRYTELGVERCLFFLPTMPRDETLRRLDEMAELAAGSPTG